MKIDRTVQPPIKIPSDVAIPDREQIKLSNGIILNTINNSDRGVVRITFVFHAGTSVQSKPFEASTTLNMLAEGSEKYNAQQIAEKMDFYGSYFEVNNDRDYSVVTFCMLRKFLKPTIEIAEQVLICPTFPEHELETYIVKRKQRLEIERSKVSFKVRELFGQAIFGEGHPYGAVSPSSDYDELTIEDLKRFYRERYVGENCFVVCSGDIDAETKSEIERLAALLPKGERNGTIDFPEPQSVKERFEEHAGAVQSAIRVGKLLFGRTHPDFVAMQVVSTILGGYFGSRLVKNLREERGYTYGIVSAMVNLDRAGYLAIATEVATEVTGDAIEQIYAEIERLRADLVSEEELTIVKNIMIGEVMRIMDGPFGVADVVIESIQNGKDEKYVSEFIEEVKKITPEDVSIVARKYLDFESFTTAVVGDKEIAETIKVNKMKFA